MKKLNLTENNEPTWVIQNCSHLIPKSLFFHVMVMSFHLNQTKMLAPPRRLCCSPLPLSLITCLHHGAEPSTSYLLTHLSFLGQRTIISYASWVTSAQHSTRSTEIRNIELLNKHSLWPSLVLEHLLGSCPTEMLVISSNTGNYFPWLVLKHFTIILPNIHLKCWVTPGWTIPVRQCIHVKWYTIEDGII